MNIIAARLYVSARTRAMTADEAETRKIAYALKDELCDNATNVAAHEMARLIDGHCTLIPVPNRHGVVTANLRLCVSIGNLLPAVRVVSCLSRSQPVESQWDRHRRKQGPLMANEHMMIRQGAKTVLLPVYYVDNVTTSGQTLLACRTAMGGFGSGLVWADAGRTRIESAMNCW